MAQQALISAPPEVEQLLKAITIERPVRQLFASAGEETFAASLAKAISNAIAPSGQTPTTGRKAHPFDFATVAAFQSANVHHSTCIHTKVASTVGLGHVGPDTPATPPATGATPKPKKKLLSKVDEALNPLCDTSWAEVLSEVCEDFWQVGNGYLEVVRAERSLKAPITGLHHLPVNDVHVYVENTARDLHYEIISPEAPVAQHFARFGDCEEFALRNGSNKAWLGEETGTFSEVIHFRRPTSLSRWYGFPDWLSATPVVELTQMILQHRFDYFLNRGVPEFMLFILGQKLTEPEWKKVENALRANIGLGNNHKSLALNLPNENLKIQLERLAGSEGASESVAKDLEANALLIVSAHRVPPLLAGIQIPGKLGATNELPNALMAFQKLVIGPAQRLFQQTLGTTLGNAELNGGLKLTLEDFAFATVIDEIDLGAMDTMSRMRQTVPEAQAQGRDLNAGVKD